MDPAKAAVWTIDSRISCHLGMFSTAIRAILDAHGGGFDRASVYAGDLSFADITIAGAMDTYFAYMAAGYLRRLGCRTRPYERESGVSDAAVRESLAIFCDAIVGRRSKRSAVKEVVDRFAAIEVSPRNRPRVAIFGDLYTRDNDQQNQGLVRFIEQHGGEVITTPYTEYMKVVARSYFRKWWREGRRLEVAVNHSLLSAALVMERRLMREFSRVLGPLPAAEASSATEAALGPFGVSSQHTGESFDNLVKIASILRHDPDVRLFVQANPAFCCPSLVSEAMASRIEAVTGVPVVTVTYDGTYAAKNDAIVPYLEFARRASEGVNPA
jgi:predicted nucleotide-binding protein (sugar kinase/HSP70/actin superfamily)